MTLDEAIKYAEEVAEEKDKEAYMWEYDYDMNVPNTIAECKKCAEEHRQLAEWLKDYKRLLEQEPSEDAIKYFDAIYNLSQTLGVSYSFIKDEIEKITKTLKALPKEPCDDAISRQAALDALDKSKYSNVFCEEHHIDWSINLGMAHIVVNELPPVTSTEKVGYWTDEGFCGDYICSVCKNEIDSDVPNMRGFNFELPKYCPNCGAKMQEVKK